MLTRVDVQSENPFFLNIRAARPSDSIILEKIEGLDPPNIDIFLGDYARDGGFYSGRRVPLRNVVLTLRINPNYKLNETVNGLRRLIYKSFLDPSEMSDTIMLILHDDQLADQYISGNVDKLETEIFDADAVVTVSILCPNPYILDVAAASVASSGPQVSFDYDGTAETGFDLTAVITGSTSFLTLDLNGRKMILTYDFAADDVVEVNTVRGSRAITVTRGGVPTSILYALVGTTWLDIHAPSNVLKLYGATSANLVANVQNLSFRGAHWGI